VVFFSAICEGQQLYSQFKSLTISNVKLDTFECIVWLNGLFFSGDDRDILKEEVTTYIMAQSSPLNSTIG
jgi:hypothetical protein